jgi:hypothetical protein
MLIVKRTDKHDLYIGSIGKKKIYNIVPKNSNKPNGGYYKKEWIENIKGVRF